MIETTTAASFIDTLERTTQLMLCDPANYKGLYDAVRDLHHEYSRIAGVAAVDISDADIMLPTGKAVSPIQAAHCLLEFQRTATFVRGVYKAIVELKNAFPGERIHVLYAGCGPYATLLTPMVTLFTANEVSFSLMDINPAALEAVKKVYDYLGLDSYVQEYICADAAVYNVPPDTTVHLAISETMQHALVKEPQVAVMQNLIPQLPAKGLFVPSHISVSAQLLDGNEEMKAFATHGMVPRRIVLGNVYHISREEYRAAVPVNFRIPNDIFNFKTLYLNTRIETFGGEVLTDYQCSLTNPKRVTEVDGKEGMSVTFNYVTCESPRFVHEWQPAGN